MNLKPETKPSFLENVGALVIGLPIITALIAVSTAVRAWVVTVILDMYTPWHIAFWPAFGACIVISMLTAKLGEEDTKFDSGKFGKAFIRGLAFPLMTLMIAWLINFIPR